MELLGILTSSINIIAQATNDSGALNWIVEKYEAGGIFMHPILASFIILDLHKGLDLNNRAVLFFDRAIYYTALGYEKEKG